MEQNENSNKVVDTAICSNNIEVSAENVDYVRGVLERTLTMISNCDNKISIMLGILGVMLVLFLSSVIDTFPSEYLIAFITRFSITLFIADSSPIIFICS